MIKSWHSTRKALGYWKWVLLDGGLPDHRYQRHIAKLQRNARAEAATLPTIRVRESAHVAVHMWCGSSQVGMAAWSWWSLLQYCGQDVAAFTHSDGSLNEEDERFLTDRFPGMKVVRAESAETILLSYCSEWEIPILAEFRRQHKLAGKVIDFHVVGDSRCCVMFDSDILFFRPPVELIEAMNRCGKETSQMSAMSDLKSMYSAPVTELSERFGIAVPERVNSGLVVMPRLRRAEFERLEVLLRRADDVWLQSYFMEQTMIAMLAGQFGSDLLPPSYFLPGDAMKEIEDTVCIHYVSNRSVRPKMFTEGIEHLKRQMKS